MRVCCLRKRSGAWIPVTAPNGSVFEANEEEARAFARTISQEGYDTAVFFGSNMVARFRDGEEVT